MVKRRESISYHPGERGQVGCIAGLLYFGYILFPILLVTALNEVVEIGQVGGSVVFILGVVLYHYFFKSIEPHILGVEKPKTLTQKYKSIYHNSNQSERYPSDWDNVRRQVLSRDGYKCGNCGNRNDLHVHHIVPLSKGGTNKLSNLRTLCEDCHKKLHPHMRS